MSGHKFNYYILYQKTSCLNKLSIILFDIREQRERGKGGERRRNGRGKEREEIDSRGEREREGKK